MLQNIALYRQVVILKEKIENYKSGIRSFQDLQGFIYLVHNGYYKGASAVGATNSEMKIIAQRMRGCQLQLKSILDENSTTPEAEKMRDEISWLALACDEIERWSARGHWKEA